MKPSLSLEAILLRLVARGAQNASRTEPKSDGRAPTSIRLKPETKHFLEAQAAVLNTSVQGLIDTILDGVMQATTDDASAQLRSIRERFFLLMQTHHLDLPAVADLLQGHGFTLSALGHADRLLDLLTPAAISFLAETFHVRSEWLRGEGSRPCEVSAGGHWYKSVPSVAKRLVQLKEARLRPELIFLRRRDASLSRAFESEDRGDWPSEEIGVVLRLHRETSAGTSFVTHETWQSERWNYGPCRRDLKLLIAFCEQMRISVVGHELADEDLRQLRTGAQLPTVQLDRFAPIAWHPDDYASFAYEVTNEAPEWPAVAKRYRESSLPAIAREAGAAELPDHPWRLNVP